MLQLHLHDLTKAENYDSIIPTQTMVLVFMSLKSLFLYPTFDIKPVLKKYLCRVIDLKYNKL